MGSLFSGIGGLELGLERSGLGHTVWQVENNARLHPCLATHWPHAQRFHDVREVGSATLAPVDLICGGFPCQDVSSAGARAGLAGARSGLWYEFARVVEEMRPRWVVVENVASGAEKWVDAVRGGLERLGYASLPIPIAASDLGAPHERARVFIVAACPADGTGERCVWSNIESNPASKAGFANDSTKYVAADTHGERLRNESRRICGPRWSDSSVAAQVATDADALRKLQPTGSERDEWRWPSDAPRIWTAEPDVARMVHGLPGRVDCEHALGNSVVPQQAEVIGYVIQELQRMPATPGKEE